VAGKLSKHKETAELFKNDFKDWVRIELELSNKNRVIPLDVLLHPAEYLAGSATALEFISETQKTSKVKKKIAKSTFESAKIWIKKQCGKWLYAFQQMECTNDNGFVDDKKMISFFNSLIIENFPRSFKNKVCNYETSDKQMDFINFNDKQEYETEDDFINRTFPIVANTMNKLVNSANKRGRKFDDKVDFDDDFINV